MLHGKQFLNPWCFSDKCRLKAFLKLSHRFIRSSHCVSSHSNQLVHNCGLETRHTNSLLQTITVRTALGLHNYIWMATVNWMQRSMLKHKLSNNLFANIWSILVLKRQMVASIIYGVSELTYSSSHPVPSNYTLLNTIVCPECQFPLSDIRMFTVNYTVKCKIFFQGCK